MVHQRHRWPGTDRGAEPVQLWLPATGQGVRYARLLTGAVAREFGFGHDDSEDLRLAVTELIFLLLQAGAVEGSLRLSLATEGRTLVVRAGCEVHPDSPSVEIPHLVERVLRSVVDGFEVTFAGGFGGFELRKALAR